MSTPSLLFGTEGGSKPEQLYVNKESIEDKRSDWIESPLSLTRAGASIRRFFKESGAEKYGAKNDRSINSKSKSTPIKKRHSEQYHRITTDGAATSFASKEELSRAFSDGSSGFIFAKNQVHHRAITEIQIPPLLRDGTPMMKVSSRRQRDIDIRLDPDFGHVILGSGKHRIVPLESIRELRSGSDVRYYRELFHLQEDYENRWLTIVYVMSGTYKSLHLVAQSQTTLELWMMTLHQLCAIRQKVMNGLADLGVREALWEKHYWKSADEGGSGQLTFERAEELCLRLSVNMSTEELQRIFSKADTQQRNLLDFKDFQRFVRILKKRREIDGLYKDLRAKNNGVVGYATFEDFMRNTQQSNLSRGELQAIFFRYSVANEETPPTREMSRDTFCSFLLSPDNSAYMDNPDMVNHDMTRPLSDYFISSSHNTYLVGNQLVGISTVEGYIRALLNGCRSVELDIYANPESSPGPMITHGGTLTSKLPLRDVCNAIAQFGFLTSPYPIIISAEMHCSYAGQEEVVGILREVFGKMLIRREDDDPEFIETLPSPDTLRGKILFKTKNLDLCSRDPTSFDRLTENVTSTTSDSDMEEILTTEHVKRRTSSRRKEFKELTDDFVKFGTNALQRVRSIGRSRRSHSPNPLDHCSQIPVSMSLPSSITSPTPASPDSYAISTPPLVMSPVLGSAKFKTKMSPALLDTLVYTVGVKFRGINKKEIYAPEHMFSLSETVANSLLKSISPVGRFVADGGADDTIDDGGMYRRGSGMYRLVKHCRTRLVRVYPRGTRIVSTNYEPHRFWSAGIQLVALNWQTNDLGYMINHAMFQRNGRAGYVLKPFALRSSCTNAKERLAKGKQHYFDVTIISAQQLARLKDSSGREIVEKTAFNPFVEVSLHRPDWLVSTGVSPYSSQSRGINSCVNSCRTNVVKNNGFNPVWQENFRIPFETFGDMMDLVFVRFVVRQEDKGEDEALGVYCASLANLGRGYRHLPLHDSSLSQYLFSTLFIKINITDA